MKKRRARTPEVSVIIPVFGEGDTISALLDHVASIASGADIEIIVADGDVRGSTIRMISQKGVTSITAQKGRAAQMNAAAKVARGDTLLFLHADTLLPESAFNEIRAFMASERCAGGAFDLGFADRRMIFRLTALFASLKHRLTRVPYGDQAIFIRRSVFESLGGYADIPLMEDIDLMKRLKRSGMKISISSSRVKTSTRSWDTNGIAYTILRNWTLQVLFLCGVSPHRLARHYYPEAACHEEA